MPPLTPPLGRRQAALGLLASALALTGCGEPEQEILPYVLQPEGVTPGVPRHFATSLTLNGYARGVVATVFEGRPVKLEGNPLHPASLGATDAFTEAALLSLYDPDRSRAVRQGGRVSSWDAALQALLPRLRALEASGGAGLRLLTGHLTSPTLLRLIGALRQRFPALHWHAHEPVGEEHALAGAALAFGAPLVARPRPEAARVILSLEADPLGPGPDQIRHARAFAARRTARRGRDEPFARLYALESGLSVTGAKADHRLALPPAGVRDVLVALAARLGAGLPAPALPPEAARFLAALADDLAAAPGAALVLAGPWTPPEWQALVHWINDRLDAPIDWLAPPPEQPEDLPALAAALRQGEAGMLVILGANPAYDAPADLGFAGLLRESAAFTLHLGPWRDETAALCRWHLPGHHPLEDWSDARAPDGTASIAQPLIRPLYGTRPAAWLLGAMAGRLDLDGHTALRETWAAQWPAGSFEAHWRQALHDGVVAGSAAPPLPRPVPRAPALPPAPDGALTLLLRPDPMLWDGRFANNPWLQECPKPLTRQVWGNAALMAPAEAARHGLAEGDVARLRLGGRSLEVPVLPRPGMAPGVVLLHLGHGRRRAGAIGDAVGADAYALRQGAAWSAPGVTLERAGRREAVLRLQDMHRLEGEAETLLPAMMLEQFRARAAAPPVEEPPPPSLYPPALPAGTPAWAMVIDTTLCIGCNACVTACQAENNIPVVGPEEVARGRDMHWLRIDTYSHGPEDRPRPGFQPVPCMHCEAAPCEPVCPVAASVHDAEGLNVQVYNRCVGTRFCQGNCPYKVRRFNFHGYADGQEYANQGAPVVAAQRNPEVSVRARGVMEKCTYCTQRISAARRAAEREGRALREGEVHTACQSACPTTAIIFGDLRQEGAAVAALRREPQHYALLGHLGTRPRTTYLAQIRNPNPALEDPGA